MDTRTIIQAIDHTNLDPCATEEEILAFAAASQGTGIASLCVQPCYVETLAQHFPGGVPICTVVGFPQGCEPAAVKAAAARHAFADGASEVDMVAPLGRIKAGDYSAVQQEVAAVLAERPAGGKIHVPYRVKVILETGALTDEEILGTVQALNQLDIDFYKTSTGFGYPGASVHAAELIMQAKRPEIQLKASGGIRTIADAEEYLRLGATRIGASQLLAACMQRLRVPLG